MKKRALITGISGQDGSYLAELLLEKGYDVHGLLRPHHLDRRHLKPAELRHVPSAVTLHFADLENPLSMLKLFQKVEPQECYHLAAPSFVSYDLANEVTNFTSGFMATHGVISALKEVTPRCRLYFAGSSEIFGRVESSPQNELTPMRPRSLYGISKLASYHLLRNFREKEGIFVACGFLYNHESPRRGPHFVTRKISIGAARIKLGLESKLVLGNLDVFRDWGYAPEYVDAMWRMLQQDEGDDYVVATGQLRSLREFIEVAFGSVGLDWQQYVETDPSFYRPAEAIPLKGDPRKAFEKLGWRAQTEFQTWVEQMVATDLKLYTQNAGQSRN